MKTIIIYMSGFLKIGYMSGFLKMVLKNRIPALSGRFFCFRARDDDIKGDDMKIKRKVSPFLLSPLVYLPFIAVLSSFYMA